MTLTRRIGPPAAALTLILGPILWAGAAEPRAFDLALMAPVLDAQQPDCHSLDIGGLIGGGKAEGPRAKFVAFLQEPRGVKVIGEDGDPGPRLRFRALYREPDQFYLLIADAQSGIPLVYSSGKTMLFYDPVAPAVYLSEASAFRLEMNTDPSALTFRFDYLLKNAGPPRIRFDLRSVLMNQLARPRIEPVVSPIQGNPTGWSLDFKDRDAYSMHFRIDPSRSSKYTLADFSRDGSPVLRFDRLERDGAVDPDVFRFPSKERLVRDLPIRDVTTTTSNQDWDDLSKKVGRGGPVAGEPRRPARGGEGHEPPRPGLGPHPRE